MRNASMLRGTMLFGKSSMRVGIPVSILLHEETVILEENAM